MSELITESGKIVKRVSANARQAEECSEREMHECLAKLKVWRIENLMSPHGMDRFAQDLRTKKSLRSLT